MRSYIRRWINEWDLRRLYPTAQIDTEEQELRPTYTEDSEMETPTEGNEKSNALRLAYGGKLREEWAERIRVLANTVGRTMYIL
jgi:hypothetical protein